MLTLINIIDIKGCASMNKKIIEDLEQQLR